jgi:hypothetical protein
MISDIASFEQSILLHLANADRCNKIQDAKKLKLFWDFFGKKPKWLHISGW